MTREEAMAELSHAINNDSAFVHDETIQMAIEALEAEPTLSEIAQHCEKRGLVLVENALFEKMKSRWGAEPIKHGRWIDAHDTFGHCYQRCSECGTYIEDVFFANDYDVNYCPHCGAKMEGGEE